MFALLESQQAPKKADMEEKADMELRENSYLGGHTNEQNRDRN